MLAFDIETTSLDPSARTACHKCGTSTPATVTVACTFDGEVEKIYHLMKPASGGHEKCSCACKAMCAVGREEQCVSCFEQHSANLESFFTALDEADSLCGFNCIRFDIPFLHRRFRVDNDRVARWVAKCTDVFLVIAEVLDVWCGLSRLLRLNGMESKSGNGQAALEMASLGRWDDLASYCARDARLTHQITCMALHSKTGIFAPAYANTSMAYLHWNSDEGKWEQVKHSTDPHHHHHRRSVQHQPANGVDTPGRNNNLNNNNAKHKHKMSIFKWAMMGSAGGGGGQARLKRESSV